MDATMSWNSKEVTSNNIKRSSTLQLPAKANESGYVDDSPIVFN